MKNILNKQLQKVNIHYKALRDLKFCVDSFDGIEMIVLRVFDFARRYGATI